MVITDVKNGMKNIDTKRWSISFTDDDEPHQLFIEETKGVFDYENSSSSTRLNPFHKQKLVEKAVIFYMKKLTTEPNCNAVIDTVLRSCTVLKTDDNNFCIVIDEKKKNHLVTQLEQFLK